MSTKIYAAYKLKSNRDLWPLIHDIRIEGQARVRKTLLKIRRGVMSRIDLDSKALAKAMTYVDQQRAKEQVATKLMHRLYRLSTLSMERNIFDYDVSVSFRSHKGKVYLIPRCDMSLRGTLNFLRKDPRLADFRYWNNTDKPRSISNAEWEHRREVWYGLDEAGQWEDVLHLEICTHSQFRSILT